MGIISCKNVSIKYGGDYAVKDTCFELEQGDYLCIVGRNGSGKSTLLKGILGLTKVNDGTIQFGGDRNRIGYLPQQNPVQNDFPASVYEVVLSGLINRSGATPFFSKGDKAVAVDNIRKLGLEQCIKKPYRSLSAGQRQRVLLARALCAADRLLMLDEPITGLDPSAASDLYSLLQSLNKQDNLTIVMVSHDVQGSLKYGNKILHMEKSPLFFGTPNDYEKSGLMSQLLGGASYA